MSRNDPIQRRVTSSSIKAAVASAAVVATLGGWAAIGLTDARQSAAAPAAQQAVQQPAQQPAQSDQTFPQLGFETRRPRFDDHEGYEQDEHEGYEGEGESQAAPQTAPQQAQPNGQTQTVPQQRPITRTRSSR